MTMMINKYKASKIMTRQDADIFSDFADIFNELNDEEADDDFMKEYRDLVEEDEA